VVLLERAQDFSLQEVQGLAGLRLCPRGCATGRQVRQEGLYVLGPQAPDRQAGMGPNEALNPMHADGLELGLPVLSAIHGSDGPDERVKAFHLNGQGGRH